MKHSWNQLFKTVHRPPSVFSLGNQPCLSLGYAQSHADMDADSLSERGWTLVRRPTGGRAILHTDEITYSITGQLEDPISSGSILESYRRLSAALLASDRLSWGESRCTGSQRPNTAKWDHRCGMFRGRLKLRDHLRGKKTNRQRTGSQEPRFSPTWLFAALWRSRTN